MRLRGKLLLAMSLVPILLTVSLYAYRELVLLPHYRGLEQVNVQEDTDRAVLNIEQMVQSLGSINADWSSWDDTYGYMETRDQQYIESNMVTGMFTDLGINVILLMDPAGRSFTLGTWTSPQAWTCRCHLGSPTPAS